MPLPLTVYCFSKIQIGFTFLVPAHLGSPGKRAVKRVCVCVFNIDIKFAEGPSFKGHLNTHYFYAPSLKPASPSIYLPS